MIARLAEFLTDHLARELTAADVWDFLRQAGHPPVDWAQDSNVYAPVHEITSGYRAGIADDRGPLAEISRSITGDLARLAADPSGPDVITVAADAGIGKTALLGQVLDTLDTAASARPIVLAARLDRLGAFTDAVSLGSALRLPGSPAAVLSRVAAAGQRF
ncbi:MAG: hypothetical protein JO345_20830 [Streptosporangiaceae bacterium]|nr:hypothetical protein [Streptosporangiaceae bacterium]